MRAKLSKHLVRPKWRPRFLNPSKSNLLHPICYPARRLINALPLTRLLSENRTNWRTPLPAVWPTILSALYRPESGLLLNAGAALPIAVLALGVPLLFRRFLMKRLAGMRGQMGGMSGMGGGETIDGSWRDAERPGQDRSPSAPDAVIIDQRDPDEDGSGAGRL